MSVKNIKREARSFVAERDSIDPDLLSTEVLFRGREEWTKQPIPDTNIRVRVTDHNRNVRLDCERDQGFPWIDPIADF